MYPNHVTIITFWRTDTSPVRVHVLLGGFFHHAELSKTFDNQSFAQRCLIGRVFRLPKLFQQRFPFFFIQNFLLLSKSAQRIALAAGDLPITPRTPIEKIRAIWNCARTVSPSAARFVRRRTATSTFFYATKIGSPMCCTTIITYGFC